MALATAPFPVSGRDLSVGGDDSVDVWDWFLADALEVEVSLLISWNLLLGEEEGWVGGDERGDVFRRMAWGSSELSVEGRFEEDGQNRWK